MLSIKEGKNHVELLTLEVATQIEEKYLNASRLFQKLITATGHIKLITHIVP